MGPSTKKIQKIHLERRRFLKTLPLQDPKEWLSQLAALKQRLFRESSFQIVGTKVYFEISTLDWEAGPRMMLEVVGVPLLTQDNSLELVDQEACELFIHKLEGDLFHLEWGELLQSARALVSALEKSLTKSEDAALGEVFHIVYNNEKIELHFFSQKDYIQKRF